MRSLPPLTAIRAFEAAARHKNYTRAGEELGLTQAGVSYQIKNLEQRVGTLLFVRQGRSMELTPAGEALAPRIAQAFAMMESAFSSLGDSEDSVLSIACFQTVATNFLAPRLGAFQLANPGIAVRIEVSNRYVDLEAGEADVALRLSHDVAPGLESHFLMHLGIAPLASPEFIAKHPELQGADPAIPSDKRISPVTGWWKLWDDARSEGRDVDGAAQSRGLEFDSQILDAAAAMSGNGIAILAPALFAAEVKAARLQRIGTGIVRARGAFRLVYPEVRRHSHKVRAFRQWLLREIQTQLADDPDHLLDQTMGAPQG
ncbi:LysR substrate-binding domain-containing protein [Erythrobacter rubeus]|uniref:LysR family transcriptional regulator n=1 Tax=Erythrobacter rubeus TaxID=2760803 RepID=A0ABR8KQX3_9SPHN|nr:LysR substrate-binding domain-containing protein [Erythrobacter rubeus]MBD2843144.1 LysR family transcriptional regulator [Erythrobacter rubeus]